MGSVTLEIVPHPTPPDFTIDAPSFIVTVTVTQGDRQLEQKTITVRNKALCDSKNRETIRWFLEKHASDDPFNLSRADEARRLLDELKLSLAEDLAVLTTLHGTNSTILRVRFYMNSDGKIPLAAYPWEVLEDKLVWAWCETTFDSCSVERIVQLSEAIPIQPTQHHEEVSGEILNILMVTARPAGSQDVSSSLVSWPLAKLISKYPGVSKRAALRVIRPGTWRCLLSELEAAKKGFYQIVHLDMHGQVEENQYTLNFLRSKGKNRSRPHKVKAEEVARALATHGVQVAVVNACESSKVLDDGSLSANLADVFIRNGLGAVVAMSFNAMDSSTEFFIGFLYLHLLVYGESLGDSVTSARRQLQETQQREATLGQNIEITDFFVPTLYSSSNFDSRQFLAPKEPDNVESKSIGELMNIMMGYMDFLVPSEFVGRASDLLELESVLEICPITLLHGPGGIGKSALLGRLSWWWKASGLVQDVIHIDFDPTERPQLDPTGEDLSRSDQIVLLVDDIIANPDSSREESKHSVISYFRLHPCVLILDSLDILASRDAESQENIRHFLEMLVDENGPGFSPGNSFVLLSNRQSTVFGWNGHDEIGGYSLGGLPLIHGIQYGVRVLSDMFARRAQLYDDFETKMYLEHLVTIVSGNPLAIEMVFPALGYPGATPRSVFEKLLTGSVLPSAEDDIHEMVAKQWKETKKGLGSRFFADITAFQQDWRASATASSQVMGCFDFLLGFWNGMFPRVIDPQAVMFMARLGSKDDLFCRRLEAQMINEKSIEDIKLLDADEVDEKLRNLEQKGFIFPVDKETLVTEKYSPEYYKIHPVLTIWLRSYFQVFSKELPQNFDLAMTIVDYRFIWEAHHVKRTMARVPKHLHDYQKIRALEDNGRWNFVAAVIIAQNHLKDQKILTPTLSPVSRLMISLSSLMNRFPDLGMVLRPYLVADLARHVKSSLLTTNESVLYSAMKLAFAMKYGAPIADWEWIEHTLDAVEFYRSQGNTYSGHLEISYMETKTFRAVHTLDMDPAHALEMFKSNLRYEPCSNDDAIGSIRRDVLKNLNYWAMAKALVDHGDAKSTSKPEDWAWAQDLDKKELAEWKNDQVHEFWSGKVKNSIWFKFVKPEDTKFFSSFAKNIYNNSQLDAISDLAPDKEKLTAYHNEGLENFQNLPEFVALMAGVKLAGGNTEKARSEFRQGMEKQLRSTNDSPANLFLHMELYKIAIKEQEWLTGARHLELICKLSPSGPVYSTLTRLAQCYEKGNRPAQARQAALAALDSARSHPSTPPAMRSHSLYSCRLQLFNMLAGIREFWYVFPKWPRAKGETSDDDDKLNCIIMIDQNLRYLHSPAMKDSYLPKADGEPFKMLASGVHSYLYQFESMDSGKATVPSEVSDELFAMATEINRLLVEWEKTFKLSEVPLEMHLEAELCCYSRKKPTLVKMAGSAWAKQMIERRMGLSD